MEGVQSGHEIQREIKIGGKESRRVESLGWLTESSIMPKKQRAINGVGASSIVELRAELYRTEEELKKAKESGGDLDVHRSRKKLVVPDVFSKKNAGVEDRAVKDKLHLKEANDGSASYAALEKKAELYDKLVRGELSDGEDTEKYNVLFYKKGTLEDEFQDMDTERKGGALSHSPPAFQDNRNPLAYSGYGAKPENDSSPRAFVPNEPKHVGWGTTGGLSQEQKQMIKEVNVETVKAREKTFEIKQMREEQAAKKREQLRKAYLKKKLEKLKAASHNSSQQLRPTVDASAPSADAGM